VNPLNRRSGLAVVEVIVAAVLILAVLGVTVGTIAKASSTVMTSQVSAKATALLNRKLAEAKTLDYRHARELGTQEGTELVEGKLARAVQLRWKRSVETSPDRADGLLITCSVEWAANGEPRLLTGSFVVPQPMSGPAVAQMRP
jgi:hypothetical protein